LGVRDLKFTKVKDIAAKEITAGGITFEGIAAIDWQ